MPGFVWLRRFFQPLLLTGLFGHTGTARARLRDAVGEGLTLLEIASVLASGGDVRRRFR